MAAPDTATGLTAGLAGFASRADALDLDADTRRLLTTAFTDTVAVMLAGRDEPVTTVVRDFVAAQASSRSDASLLLGRQRASARNAALVNATAAHALDYDDVGLMGHPSAVLVPALLAEGERLGAGGEALMRAYVAGYETWAELVSRDPDLHHQKGWHPTAVFGVVAVAAAVAALRRLDAARCAHALGIAASMAGGVTANFGSMTKPLHAGHAASQGIDAVDMAEAGLTSAADALEHPRGFLAALSPRGRVDLDAAKTFRDAGPSRIGTLGLTVKKYPMCFAAHRVLDGLLDLVHGHDIAVADVERVDVTLGEAQAAMLRNHRPGTGLEAKFSIEFAVACALLVRKAGLAELTDDFVRRPELQALFDRVRIHTTDTVCAEEPTLAASDRVQILLRDGQRLDSGEVARTRGDPSSPMTTAELRVKFMDCAARVVDVDGAALFDRLQQLDAIDDIGQIARGIPIDA